MVMSVILRQREERRLLAGHLWVFSNEVASVSGTPIAGEVVDVLRHDGKFLGIGFYHPHSLIAVRMLSGERMPIDRVWFHHRIEEAARLRKQWFPDDTVYRVVHGESDRLPGLIIDRYGTAATIQALSAGMDQRIEVIRDVVSEVLGSETIVARNDSALRTLEHLPRDVRSMQGSASTVEVTEHGLRYRVDLLEGQKTGLFLDQKANRMAIRPYLRGRRVLDCFCNDGGFSMNASVGGAHDVEGIDISGPTVQRAAENAQRNGLTNVVFKEADVFEELRTRADRKERFGGIILDPPSFTKSKKTVASALHGYRTINTLALRMVEQEGILVTASCSHHIDRDTFLGVIRESAIKAGRSVRLLDFRGAAPDHPLLPAMPETGYLKLAILSVT